MSFRLIEVTLIDSEWDIWEAKFLPVLRKWLDGDNPSVRPLLG